MFRSVRVQNFRSYSDFAVEFGDGVSIIVGANAAGKTNLLESLLVAAKGGSYRAKDADLIKLNNKWARIDVLTEKEERSVKLEVDVGRVKKSFAINNTTYPRLSFDRRIPIVLFEPEHLRLLSGSPERRREFIDNFVDQTNQTYSQNLRRYKRALLQRNALLKSNNFSEQEMFVWNVRLSEMAGLVVEARTKAVDVINEQISEQYSKIAGSKHKIRLEYVCDAPISNYANSMLGLLNSNLGRDIVLGHTSVGPHRDDIKITFNTQPANQVASRGEVRSLLLALKIIELTQMEELLNERAILLLDDVFSELDGKRRKALTEILSSRQAIITTTDADLIGRKYVKLATSILI